ncbi:VCBS domain-containing protein, partial [Marinomonas ostreistagni]|uniref:VCBS domain-containing protein n=1 Tax=Marinomonas ostreistagni TaxID=359209 RepID=UPI001950F0AE
TTLTITITGTNDAPVATAATAAVQEDASVSGTVTASDVDLPAGASLTFSTTSTATGLTFNSDGTYTFDASSYDSLSEGETQAIVVPVTVTDDKGATDTTTLTITITGTNDAPVVSGKLVGAVTEGDVGDVITTSGTISISDVDGDDTPSFANTTVTGSYGSLTLVDGTWTYTLDQTKVQDLDIRDEVTDTITLTATDDTAQNIVITITGTDDAPEVTGTFTGSVSEGNVGDAAVTASGTISISDVDADDSPSFANTTVTGSYGSLTLVGGAWTYTLDQSKVQDLDGAKDGQSADQVTDTITLTADDGTPQSIVITITGTDDAPVVTGTFTGSVSEGNVGDAAVTASGTISISDVDANDSPAFADTSTPVQGMYGSLTLVNGAWTYTLDQTKVQDLEQGDKVTDTITLTATDGTPQNIVITITGTNDAPVATAATAAVQEDASVSG